MERPTKRPRLVEVHDSEPEALARAMAEAQEVSAACRAEENDLASLRKGLDRLQDKPGNIYQSMLTILKVHEGRYANLCTNFSRSLAVVNELRTRQVRQERLWHFFHLFLHRGIGHRDCQQNKHTTTSAFPVLCHDKATDPCDLQCLKTQTYCQGCFSASASFQFMVEKDSTRGFVSGRILSQSRVRETLDDCAMGCLNDLYSFVFERLCQDCVDRVSANIIHKNRRQARIKQKLYRALSCIPGLASIVAGYYFDYTSQVRCLNCSL